MICASADGRIGKCSQRTSASEARRVCQMLERVNDNEFVYYLSFGKILSLDDEILRETRASEAGKSAG